MSDIFSPGAALLIATAIILDVIGFLGDLLIATGLGAIPGIILCAVSDILGVIFIGGADFLRTRQIAVRSKIGVKKILKRKAGKFLLTFIGEDLLSALPLWTIYVYSELRSG